MSALDLFTHHTEEGGAEGGARAFAEKRRPEFNKFAAI